VLLVVGAEVLQIVDLTAERTIDVRTPDETRQARVMDQQDGTTPP